jgi:predicted ATPase
MDEHDIRFNEAELNRLKGELLLRQLAEGGSWLMAKAKPCPQPEVERPGLTEAEACFRQALDTARHQHAKSLELRAAIGLSRLWQQQGKSAAARDLLAGIYGWFTEGFDTVDLQAAKALLETLQ